MLPMAAAIAAIGKATGGVIGAKVASGADKAYEDALKRYQQSFANADLPELEDYVSQYEQLDPEALQQYQAMLEQNIDVGDTEQSKIQTDPMLRSAQMEALQGMIRRGQEGLTVTDEAERNALLRNIGVKQQGAQQAIQQEMQRRGMAGSGTEIASRLASAQGAYADAAAQGEALAAQRQQAKMAAIQSAGTMAGSLENADYNKAKSLADARDAISKFNTQNRLGVQTRNVGSQQNAGNSNVGLANNTTAYNNSLVNKNADQLSSGKISNITQGNANKQGAAKVGVQLGEFAQDKAKRKADAIAGMFSAGADAMGGMMGGGMGGAK